MRLSNLNIKKINFDSIDSEYSGQDILIKSGELLQFESGIYAYGNVLRKLEIIVENIMIEEFDKIGCIHTKFPILQPRNIWNMSNRWSVYTTDNDIMFNFNNNLGEYGLAPTAEECATLFSANRLLSYKNLPAVYYQIGTKFRKEIRCRGYLFRTREFVMFDAYSFDKDEVGMNETYEKIKEAYFKVFERLGIKVMPTIASGGTIGGGKSHEWQAELSYGEDEIIYDDNKMIGLNSEVLDFDNRDEYLRQFGIDDLSKLKKYRTIELGHTFQLGTKYSDSMKAFYIDSEGNKKTYFMGCYGLGVDRIVATIIENSVIKDNGKVKGMVLPYNISPYKVHIIYNDSNEEKANDLYKLFLDNGINVIIDDRKDIAIGAKIKDVYAIGTPKMIVLGNKYDGKKYLVEDMATNMVDEVDCDNIIEYIKSI